MMFPELAGIKDRLKPKDQSQNREQSPDAPKVIVGEEQVLPAGHI